MIEHDKLPIQPILGITGHRPKKLYGYDDACPGNLFIINAMGEFFKEHWPNKVITGMALGADQWAAQWCIKLEIPFIAAVPTEGQENMWPEESKKKYQWLLERASTIVIVTPTNPGTKLDLTLSAKMQKRNEWIVDHSDSMLSVFGGYAGGTRNCLEYAKEKEKHIDIINPGDYYKTV
ncbi:hypothetical protein LCGC14_1157220 [marine sediment metagenome]|uniref:DNA recombination-mediator protein A n=1 Tax=marine sediment metagenome TaxID=412755 RepID=A0A0F9PZ82_9ZZZZ